MDLFLMFTRARRYPDEGSGWRLAGELYEVLETEVTLGVDGDGDVSGCCGRRRRVA